MRIAVTGATGFVGRALLRDGAAAGHSMRAVTRSARSDLGVEAREIRDITDQPGLTAAFAGMDAVVHLAARVHVMHAEGADALDRFRAVNVEGTRAVMEAARAAGARRLVFLSTAKVLGEGRAERVLRDGDPFAPEGAYAESKVEMEHLIAASSTNDWTVLRPPLVYGPGVGGNFRRLLQLARLGRVMPLPLGAVRNRRSMVYVRNLANAVLHGLADERARGRAYLVTDGYDVGTAELIRRIALASRQRVWMLPMPPELLRTLLGAVGRGAEADRLLDSFAVDPIGIHRDLGWLPPFTMDQGIEETVRWWQGNP